MGKSVRKRRRGSVIVDTPKGIMVVSGRKKLFILAGGGASKKESRKDAAIRELEEETGLKIKNTRYLFKHKGSVHKSYSGGYFRDHNKVFLVETIGTPKPQHEIKHIAYYSKDSDINISKTTKKIIDAYLELSANWLGWNPRINHLYTGWSKIDDGLWSYGTYANVRIHLGDEEAYDGSLKILPNGKESSVYIKRDGKFADYSDKFIFRTEDLKFRKHVNDVDETLRAGQNPAFKGRIISYDIIIKPKAKPIKAERLQ
jgi:8-oxo-dGTP diphosphatase